ncbi:hypothetical protein C0J29_30535 (plasmid) [Mycobacterium paragordonae]|uniref:Uncharacterized protein n=1 Tax=Mycobacterium paragordonae TaxID=1389713 RepID=A0AAJ1SB03_9MYCO|nr:hypothetical protein [Mycobacterium paragordonae]AYE99310.1 hypothetical protein C0J29_30535 [Mycobacterium paragordonae]MDP7739372.1 hypothetical protein [Mycobacterium paragordonae]PJE25171.1 MAG: hypothetical protein CK431_02165 [Mycobacterium sp.]GFG82934.1 hypothetical protein MPRG_62100 [Mycobacterium paragordonae]
MNPTHPPTFTRRAAEHLGYHLATRPRLRRICTLWLTTHLLATWAVVAAPTAAASTLAGALNWTGVTDSHAVPVGNYYLSVVSTSEALTRAGPELTADPTSWTRWLANAVTTGLTHQSIVQLLQLEAALYIFMITTALWLMRFAMSNTWLYWLATWFRPLFDIIRALLTDLWVFPLCMLAGLAVGAYHILWHGRKGHGSGIMLSTFIIGILGLVLTRDPLTELYNENGLLGRARDLGFQIAQAFANNGPVTGGGTSAQLQHLTGLIADATLRMPLQLMNFGTPVDDIGSCGNAYTAAILSGKPDGPAHAMSNCGAQQALAFAQQLDGANLALGAFYLLLGAAFTLFVFYVTYSYVMVCCAAFINALFAVVAAAPAMIHGRPRQRALRRLTLFFKHALLVFVYTTYVSVAAVIVLKMAARGGYADQVGMTHPLARLVMIALISAVAIGGLWWLKRELGDHTRHDITHLVTAVAREASYGYVRGRAGIDRVRDTAQRLPGMSTAIPAGTSVDGQDDSPLTGNPVDGRPPGGRPPGSGGRTPCPVGPTSPSGSTAAGGGGATPPASRAAAAAATVVPEAAAAAAVATQTAQQLHHSNGQRTSAPNSAPQAQPPLHTRGPAAPDAAVDMSGPAPGRAGNVGPPAAATASQPPRDLPHPVTPPDCPPVQGRQR